MPVRKLSNPTNPKKPWQADIVYTDWQGNNKRLRKIFSAKKEAAKFEEEFLYSINIGTDIPFHTLVQNYIEFIRPRIREITFISKETIIKNKILPYFKNKVLKDIKAADIMRWQTEIIRQGYSKTYQKAINTQLSAIFNYAIKFFKMSHNPIHITGSIGSVLSNRQNYYTIEEFMLFWHAVNGRPLSKIIFPLLFFSGMRSGECLALTLNDFDYDKQSVSISKTYSRIRKKDVITEPKTPKSNRVITLPKFIFDLLDEYVAKLYDYSPSERLFMIDRSYLFREMQRGANTANLKHIRVHDLRHSHASLLISQGNPPTLIQQRLGHENVETTLQIYSHLYPQQEKDLSSLLDRIWSKANTDNLPSRH